MSDQDLLGLFGGMSLYHNKRLIYIPKRGPLSEDQRCFLLEYVRDRPEIL